MSNKKLCRFFGQIKKNRFIYLIKIMQKNHKEQHTIKGRFEISKYHNILTVNNLVKFIKIFKY